MVPFLVEWNYLCKFGRWHHGEQFCELTLNCEPVAQEEMLFKDISYLDIWRSICSAERNYLCNFMWRVS